MNRSEGAARPLDLGRILAATASLRLGRPFLYLASAESTSDLAWEAAGRGDPEGGVFAADEQTRGRGRFGRAWHSPAGRGLWLSVLLRPGIEPVRWPLLTVAGALAVAEAVEASTSLPARIRWPNDVVLGGRKVAGILAESRGTGADSSPVVLGIGVNVGQEEADFPEELRSLATSLCLQGARVPDRTDLAITLLRALDARYAQARADHRQALGDAWRRFSAILHTRVSLRVRGADTEGVVDDVDPVDGIRLRLPDGRTVGFRQEHVERLTPL